MKKEKESLSHFDKNNSKDIKDLNKDKKNIENKEQKDNNDKKEEAVDIKKQAYPTALSFIKDFLDNIKNNPDNSLPQNLSKTYSERKEKKERAEENLQTYELLSENTKLDSDYFTLLITSCLIATFGLLKSSAAVIIGGMLIAPLMMPILSFSLSIIWSDKKLFINSIRCIVFGIIISIFISFLIALFSTNFYRNQEINARIAIDFYDILIAITSGFVGAYAFAKPNIASSISGVAIAVALMPPLCVVGICLSQNLLEDALSAFILFCTNLSGIAFASSFVFWQLHVRPFGSGEDKAKKLSYKNMIFSCLLLIIISMTLILVNIQQSKPKQILKTSSIIIKENIPNSEILSQSVEKKRGIFYVKMTITYDSHHRTLNAIQTGKLKTIKNIILKRTKENVEIEFILLPSIRSDSSKSSF